MKHKVNKIFLTFGAGDNNYYEAVNRLTNQAKSLNVFDKIIGLTDKDLKEDIKFWDQHSNFILNNKRGYGYWVWKSYIILKTLQDMNDNDILLFLDCGCELNIDAKDKIIEYFELVKDKLVLSTTSCIEKQYTKRDLIIKLDCGKDKYLNTCQIQGGILLLKKCDIILNIIQEWYNLSCNYENIDDSLSIHTNYDNFIEHRHDSSIISLLLKKNNLNNNFLDPTWTSNFKDIDTYKNQTSKWLIWANRNKTGESIIYEMKNK